MAHPVAPHLRNGATVIEWGGITVGNVLTILILGVTGLVAYFGWQRAVEIKFGLFDNSVAARFATMEKSFDVKFSALAIQINTIMMRDVESLRAKAESLEADNRALHKRYHDMANDMNGIGLKVDRLERPRA